MNINKNKLNKKVLIAITCMLISYTAGCGSNAVITRQTDEQQTGSIENTIVSYLGPEGTYTQEACGVFFGRRMPPSILALTWTRLEGRSQSSSRHWQNGKMFRSVVS